MQNFLKNFSPNSYIQNAHPDEFVSNNKYGYIDMETTYRGEPKDRNIETVDDL